MTPGNINALILMLVALCMILGGLFLFLIVVYFNYRKDVEKIKKGDIK